MSLNLPPARITAFIEEHHVAGLALLHPDGTVWVALIVLSSGKTRHVEAMRFRADIAGTIAGQPQEIRTIQGIQFRASALEIGPANNAAALQLYYKKFPLVRAVFADVWRLRLNDMKFTDNTFVFGQKTLWSRGEEG